MRQNHEKVTKAGGRGLFPVWHTKQSISSVEGSLCCHLMISLIIYNVGFSDNVTLLTSLAMHATKQKKTNKNWQNVDSVLVRAKNAHNACSYKENISCSSISLLIWVLSHTSIFKEAERRKGTRPRERQHYIKKGRIQRHKQIKERQGNKIESNKRIPTTRRQGQRKWGGRTTNRG